MRGPDAVANAELPSLLEGKNLGLRFGVTYAAIAGILFGLYCFPYELFGVRENWFSSYLAAYARLAGAVISVFETGVTVSGTHIIGRFPLQIVKNCDAVEVNILFASAILAVPVSLKRRAVALFVGLLSLVLANVIRILSLYYTGIHFPNLFAVAHEELWPLVLIAFAAISFLFWVRWMRASPAPDVPAAAS